MRYLIAVLVCLFLTGCTISAGVVKDVRPAHDGQPMMIDRCDLVVYLAFYGLVTAERNCRTEVR